jgi:hypothetical protein
MTAILLLATVCFGEANADGSDLTADQRRQLDSVLSEFKESREQLRSGIYRAFGTKRDGITGDKRFPSYRGEVEIFSAFDHDRGLFRFDRSEPNLFEEDPSLPMRRVNVQLKYVRTPDVSLHVASGWQKSGVGEILVKPPDAAPTEYLLPMDVRNLGAASWHAMSKGVPLEQVVRVLQRPRVVEVTSEDEGIVRFARLYGPNDSLKSVYWFDTRQGFSPIRFEFLERGRDGEWQPPLTVNLVTWKDFDGVWVPEALSIIDQQAGNGRVQSYDLQFRWESVNGSPPEELFRLESLQLERGTPIIDRRWGRPIVVGRVGDESPAQHVPPSPNTPPKSRP